MSKYAPPREDGKKPYVVEQAGWGRKRERIGWGNTVAEAKHNAFGRPGVEIDAQNYQRKWMQ